MKRLILHLILCAAVWCGGAPNVSASARDEFLPADAKLIENAAAALFPGSRLEWEPLPALVEGTTRKHVHVAGFDRRKDADGGYTGAVAFNFVDDQPAISAAIEKFETPPTRALATVAAFKANVALAITEVRRGSLSDAAAAIEQVENVSLSSLTYKNVWPDVYVTYTGVYGTAGMHGTIMWELKLVVDPTPSVFGRVPVVVARVDKDSPLLREDRADVRVVNETTLAFASGTSGHVISNCADPCLPDGRVLLALWFTAPRAVAVP